MFFDIGANIGRWALANAAAANKIIAVEADPNTHAMLVTNTQGTNIVCENYAVCDSLEFVTFYSCTTNTLSSLNRDWLTDSSSRFCGQPFTEIRCPTISLDALIAKYGTPDLIKVDVEGGEFETIRSLTKKVPLLCFEWAAETADIAIQALTHLVSLEFTEFAIQDGDDYTFRPIQFTDSRAVRDQLVAATAKVNWGMVWCK
jgi:FkbM family methyltransferase